MDTPSDDETTRRAPPGVVPYVEWHTGPRRVVTLHLTPSGFGSGMVRSQLSPVVSIDGRQFPVYWGAVSFEAPSDRAVHVAVSIDDATGVASILLPPGPDVQLGYEVSSGTRRLQVISSRA